jgi:hypothetical protein
MKPQLLIGTLLLMAFVLTSCNKDYSCICTNPGGEYTALKLKSTEAEAIKKCQDYYDTNFGSVPWSETHCEVK